MKNYWLSWYVGPSDGFELNWPWWVSGSRDSDGAQTICVAIRAGSENAAREAVLASYDERPAALDWRFVEERPADWTPYCDRFRQAKWMPEWPVGAT